ncbi:MAG: DNA/RNA non-specific endonuclease [Bacteroidales bacterium]|nr:DNA/RNA non-specific endonuclease [Bacteroidales bacterium]
MKVKLRRILLMISGVAILCFSACSQAVYDYPNILNFASPSPSSSSRLLKHDGFTVSYMASAKQAEWVRYVLTGEHAQTHFGREGAFWPDPLFPDGATDDDYYMSGYDRGHLFPAACAWTENIMKESFYYTNVSPQLPSFNRGIWKSVEAQVREWAVKYDSIYVVTGSVIYDDAGTFGDNIPVPSGFYTIVVVCTSRTEQGIAVYVPHENSITGSVINYAMSIDELEEILDMDFCIYLPESKEAYIESAADLSEWFEE